MALPTGTISMSQVNTELGRSSTAQISLGESAVRGLAGKSSGAISMSDLRGESAWEGTLANLPALTTWTRTSLGATAGLCTIAFRYSGIFTAHNGNAGTSPVTSGPLGNITNQRWDGNDAATRSGSEVRFTLLGVTNHQGSAGTQSANYSGWRATSSVDGLSTVICHIPQYFNDNTYRFRIELRMAGNSSTTISKEFALRITNMGS